MKLALIQLNQTIGDLCGNAARIAAAVRKMPSDVDICVTSEMSLTGYPPRDLLLQRAFVREAHRVLRTLAEDLRDYPPVLVGLPVENPASEGRPLFNAAALLREGQMAGTFPKSLLPTYDVFDEDRYFEPGPGVRVWDIGGQRCALSICEDVWIDEGVDGRRRYHRDPIEAAEQFGADVLINMSASPFVAGKQSVRERMLADLARRHSLAVTYVNQVGGNDDLIFDGRSIAFNKHGELIARAAGFTEDALIVDLDAAHDPLPAHAEEVESELFAALVLGTRDYASKCGLTHALLGLSGGVDSALTAVIAVRALGPERVRAVLMPSTYSSKGSVDDAKLLAARLGIETVTLPITSLMGAYDTSWEATFEKPPSGTAEENIQARIRGNLLMTLANETNALLLTTGNKSELAVGYCTLYGDMCGGLGVIADLSKTMVYRVCRWLNDLEPIIPEAILAKPPSAELRPDQLDQDSLPPYDVLDQILERYIERREPAETIIHAGFDEATVRYVIRLVRLAEFKRKQAAPGLKVTDRAFGTGWRMPIARGVWEPVGEPKAKPPV